MKFVIALLSAVALTSSAANLEEGFRRPPEQTKPWCYWYWISDNISKEGLTRDLEAMARVGIGEALIGNIFLDDIPAGKVKVLSEDWWSLVEHTIREGGRTGVNIGMFNCPGWSQSGGPWIKPEQAMRYLVSSETRVTGPAKFHQKLATPKEPFQDVAVLAFPAPQHDADLLATVALKGSAPVEIELSQPQTARSVAITPGETGWSATCELLVAGEDGQFRSVKSFKFDRSNMNLHVGPIPRGPVVVSFPATTAKRFRLVLTHVAGKSVEGEVTLSAAARVESFIEKQLGKMHPTPLPMWDTYLWPAATEPDLPAIPPRNVLNLTAKLSSDGTLRWDVPAGEWVILRTGMTTTGTRNAPASPEGQGLEVDKMNRAAARVHFDAFIGQLLKRMPTRDRKAFKHVVADSYEMGSQNWTDGFGATFRKRYGYDPTPWLPVLTGRVVGSADLSDRFLWDLRRLVADHIATDYVGGLRDLCRPHGLQLWLENYGHWGFPAEFLQYGGQSDCIGGEFWATGNLGSIELRAASSCANTYGKPIVSAEAFTGGPAFQSVPSSLKARGDWAFCEGINHFVFHVYIHQPWEDRRPGINAWFGTEFNRHNTWFDASRAWVDYLRRCCFLLQQGARVADVAYFIGDDAPKMTGVCKPELPTGCDFDYINAEVILDKLSVKNGLLTLPHGTTYRALVLPELATMRPAVLRKIVALSKAGAKVIGPAPSRSPSMENYPRCDEEVRRLATELRTVPGLDIASDFQSGKKLLFTHRRGKDADIYFVTNPQAKEITTVAMFRIDGKAAELWCPVTGRVTRPAVYDQAGGTVRLPMRFGPHGSVFVVFREKTDSSRIVSVTRNGKPLLDTTWTPSVATESKPGNFTFALWVKPAADTTLLAETNEGVRGMGDPRNDVIFPAHGGANGAGSGLAVGRNGVSVFEHGASYFAPVLVHASSLSDWTHVAVVYRDNQPSLYLNGKFVHRGLKSSRVALAPSGTDLKFRGETRGFESVSLALGDSEIVELMKTPETERAVELTRDEALAWQPGDYALKSADGKARTLNVASVPAPQEIAGPWEVQFGAEKVTFEKLADWTTRSEETIRHYSGVAIYRKVFSCQSSVVSGRTYLDLGTVHGLATVRLNGKTLGTFWLAPWRVDVTDAVKQGRNELEIEVVNAWNNRLVGDRALPSEKRQTFMAKDTLAKNAPLQASGLVGPVMLRIVERHEIK
ncbi:MAG: hypothetical protein FJ395_19510 [Verrucomicrobia bacterium]|nr:hypothetical protein [Verrucomicrobiota bacterium]